MARKILDYASSDYPNFHKVCETFGEPFAILIARLDPDARERKIAARCSKLQASLQIRIAEAHRDGTVTVMPRDCGVAVTTRCDP